MRGKVAAVEQNLTKARITPAHAGKSGGPKGAAGKDWDHPRACGEKRLHGFPDVPRSGSPPRMRGKVQRVQPGRAGLGITPAHAGKRRSFLALRLAAGDHPRACGEKSVNCRRRNAKTGSPPRMRGKAAAEGILAVLVGITPAHAGKRTWPRRGLSRLQDHPRACGEKMYKDVSFHSQPGSPPRMRGKD